MHVVTAQLPGRIIQIWQQCGALAARTRKQFSLSAVVQGKRTAIRRSRERPLNVPAASRQQFDHSTLVYKD